MLFAALTEHGTQKVSRELKDKRPINSKDSEVWREMCCPVSESRGLVAGHRCFNRIMTHNAQTPNLWTILKRPFMSSNLNL